MFTKVQIKIETIIESVEKRFGLYKEIEANNLAKSLIQNIDDFYHRAWVIKSENLTK